MVLMTVKDPEHISMDYTLVPSLDLFLEQRVDLILDAPLCANEYKLKNCPRMTEICYRDLPARNLNLMHKFLPEDYKFFFIAWCLPVECISTSNCWLEGKQYNVDPICASIDDIIIKAVIAGYPTLKQSSYHACFPCHDLAFGCFEVLGFDIILETVDDRPGLDYTVQDCPILLRQGVFELFAGTEVFGQLTVVTLSQSGKSQTGSKVTTDVEDIEELTKQFVLAAQDIQYKAKLKLGGYWADFINPFSGFLFLSPAQHSKLYETDERFRCLGFRIFEENQCKIIAERSTRNFIGSLFMSVPPNTERLREILQQYEK